MSYPAYVRSRRVELGMTQKQLADAVGVTQPAIALVETESNRAAPWTVVRIARAFGDDPLAHLVMIGLITAAEARLTEAA